ncbi:alpha/beta fold hydrolase [Nonomuraea mesophila]|nr:alpha/beta fold hydrolase [Nonomuraea mesophila]
MSSVRRSSTKPVLFCVPHAGGTASSFAAWRDLLHDCAEIRPVELAGKGARTGERPYTRLQDAAADVADIVQEGAAGRPWAIIGHSLGALIAYEAVRVLGARGHPPAQRLVVSGCPAPRPGSRANDDPQDDKEVARLLQRLDGIPPEISDDPEAVSYFAGLVRDDGRLLAAYTHVPPSAPFPCPVTVLVSTDDPITSGKDPADWELAVARPVRIRQVTEPGHFFPMSDPRQCARVVRDEFGWPPAPGDTGSRLYLNLLKKILTNVIYEDPPVPSEWNHGRAYDRVDRVAGLDWPSRAHTMVGMRRLDNVQTCIERVLRDEVPGDLIETGVWRGGTTIFMRAVLAAWEVRDRVVWVADSFQGMPEPKPGSHREDARLGTHTFNDFIGVPLDTVKRNFTAYGLLDEQVRFLPGWFSDTLPAAPMERLAVLRLDADLYESTMDALTHLYPKLSPGGFVIIDDYFLKVCRDAVYDFRRRHGIDDEIRDIDGYGAFWRRGP